MTIEICTCNFQLQPHDRMAICPPKGRKCASIHFKRRGATICQTWGRDCPDRKETK